MAGNTGQTEPAVSGPQPPGINFCAALGQPLMYAGPLGERSIADPTEIQRRVIPRLLEGESLVFRSATGTGKTFAYLLPLLERLTLLLGEEPSLRGRPLLLIAAPTFELCSQIKNEADFLLKAAPMPVHTALLIGSAAPGRQIDALKKERPEVIVGNPGRILALARQAKLKLRDVRFLVLDEGDRLVADELFSETREMVSLLKPGFLGVSCSATVPAKSRERLFPLLGIPAGQKIVDDSAPDVLREKVEHWAFYSPEREKIGLLRSLLAALEAAGGKGKKGRNGAKRAGASKALIFTSSVYRVENTASRLRHYGLSAAGLSGAMDSKHRKETLDAFRSGSIRFLVSSDLAARGLDIDGISHVIALDVSEDRDVYLHRAGRTARAGKRGVMVSIGTEGEMRRLAALEKSLGLIVYPKILYEGKVVKPE